MTAEQQIIEYVRNLPSPKPKQKVIAERFGVTRQYVSLLLTKYGVDWRSEMRKRKEAIRPRCPDCMGLKSQVSIRCSDCRWKHAKQLRAERHRCHRCGGRKTRAEYQTCQPCYRGRAQWQTSKGA